MSLKTISSSNALKNCLFCATEVKKTSNTTDPGQWKYSVYGLITFFGYNTLNVNSSGCISMNNQESKTRSEIINVNTNEPMFYPYSIKRNKCKGICNTIKDPYAKFCVSDAIKNINFKVFNLMSRTNETRHIEWHKNCKCKYRLDASVCNNKKME